MPTRDAGVGQTELGVLPAADDVRALAQLVGPAAAVIELQGDRRSSGRVAALLPVVAVATAGLLAVATTGLSVVVVVCRGFGVPGGGSGVSAARAVSAGRRGFGVLGVVAGAVVLSGIAGAALLVARLLVAALLGVTGPLFRLGPGARRGRRGLGGITALVSRSRTAAVIGVTAIPGLGTGRRLPVATALSIALVVALVAIPAGRTGRGRRTLFVGLLVATLVWVTALVGGPGRLVCLLVRVGALFRRISARILSALRTWGTARILLRTAVAVVVVLVPPLPLPLTAVAWIVSHRWYSWFCAKRII